MAKTLLKSPPKPSLENNLIAEKEKMVRSLSIKQKKYRADQKFIHAKWDFGQK
jgi:hypothetical protein